jgi:hypothetical protein
MDLLSRSTQQTTNQRFAATKAASSFAYAAKISHRAAATNFAPSCAPTGTRFNMTD